MGKHPKYLEKDMKFGRLTVLYVDETSKYNNNNLLKPSQWKYVCICECGNIVSVAKNSLCGKDTRSCGCLQKEKAAQTGHKNHKVNKIEISDNIIKIFFFNTNNYTIIDKEDYEKVKDYCWYERPDHYVLAPFTKNKRKKGYSIHARLHRLIMNAPKNKMVDHINGNPLDNRKCNLRICTSAQNSRNAKMNCNNTSGYKGIYWVEKLHKWRAEIKINYVKKNLGVFSEITDAIDARKKAEIKYFGEYRRK